MPLQEINLLPPERRRRVRNESIAVSVTDIIRSVNTGLLLMSLFGGALILSIWLYQVATVATTQEELKRVIDEYQLLRDQVAEQNAILDRLASLGEQRLVWSDFLATFFAATPSGITFNRLSGASEFVDGSIANSTLTMSGQAITRSALTVYERQLKALARVAQVSAPTSNLLERTNPLFQFTLTLKPIE